jgi:hypothetical protein
MLFSQTVAASTTHHANVYDTSHPNHNPNQNKRQRSDISSSSGADEGGFGDFDPRALNTVKGHKQAIAKWDEFAAANNNIFGIPKIPTWSELTVDIVCGDLGPGGFIPLLVKKPPIQKFMAKFCTHLLSIKKTGGDDYQPWVVVQYLSSFKAILFKRFDQLGFLDASPEWYQDLYHGLRMKACNRCIARGGRLSKKASVFARETLRDCCLYLMKHQDQLQGSEDRAVLVSVFQAIGRAGEIGNTTWDSLDWDGDNEHIAVDWGELKTGQQYLMTFHPDASDWVLCSFHAMACYLIMGPTAVRSSTAEAEANYMFPAYVHLGDASTKVSNVLDKCRKSEDNPKGVEGIPSGAASHSLRKSSFNAALLHPCVGLLEAICRGGWSFKGDSNSFLYLESLLHVTLAGKALANWRHPEQHVSAPTLAAIKTDTNRTQVDHFVQYLFHESVIAEKLDGDMKKVRDVFAATLLMYYDDVLDDCGDTCLVIKKIHNAALECLVDFGIIKEWGKGIKQQFIVSNASNLGGLGGDEQEKDRRANDILLSTCSELLVEKKAIRAQMNRIEDKTDTGNQLCRQILHQLTIGGGSGQQQIQPTNTANSTTNSTTTNSSTTNTATTAANTAQPPSDAFASIAHGQQTQDTLDWTMFDKWGLGKFMQAVMKNRQSIDTIQNYLKLSGLDGTEYSSKRTRAKKIIGAITAALPEEDKKYFDYCQLPTDHDSKIQWLNYISSNGHTWANKLKGDLFERYKGALVDIVDGTLEEHWETWKQYKDCVNKLNGAERKMKNSGLEVGKLASFLEDTERYENLRASARRTGKIPL